MERSRSPESTRSFIITWFQATWVAVLFGLLLLSVANPAIAAGRVQEYLPKAPPYAGPETEDDFRGFALGYVELPGEVIVESRLTGCAPGDLRIGMPVQLVVVPFRHEPDGTEVVTYAFAPVLDEEDAP